MQIFDVKKCGTRIVLAVLRIWDVYTGSGILIFPCQIPDQGLKDPGSGSASAFSIFFYPNKAPDHGSESATHSNQ